MVLNQYNVRDILTLSQQNAPVHVQVDNDYNRGPYKMKQNFVELEKEEVNSSYQELVFEDEFVWEDGF